MESISGNPLPSAVQPLNGEQKHINLKPQEEYAWIINEGVLRDEGSLYGIAAADIDDKLLSISAYYAFRSASHLQTKTFLQDKLESLGEVISKGSERLTQIRKFFEEAEDDGKVNLLPLCFQFIAILAVCVFNFFLVRYWLTPVNISDIISVGIYLLGLFSVFIGRGIMDNFFSEAAADSDERGTSGGWKIYLREFGVSAAIALFICTISWNSYPKQNSLVAFLLMFLLFLCGKVLVNTMVMLRKQTAMFRQYRLRSRHRKEEKKWQKKIEEAESNYEIAKKELQDADMALKKLDAEHQYKKHVFLSEYKLAIESPHMMSKPPLKQLA